MQIEQATNSEEFISGWDVVQAERPDGNITAVRAKNSPWGKRLTPETMRMRLDRVLAIVSNEVKPDVKAKGMEIPDARNG